VYCTPASYIPDTSCQKAHCISRFLLISSPFLKFAREVVTKFNLPRSAIQVRWSNGQAEDPQATWLASGGESGIVRCQRISLYVIF